MKNFRKFYRNNKGRLFGYFLRMTGNYDLSADLMQDSFTRYYERYKDKDTSVALLFTIGRNLLFDTFRRKDTTKPYEEDRYGQSRDQEKRILIREECRQVLSAMQRLGKDEREMLTLAVSENMPYRKIAEITGTSESNVKVKIHRSRLKLKKILRSGDL